MRSRILFLIFLSIGTTTYSRVKFAPEAGLNLAFMNERTSTGGLMKTQISRLSPGYKIGVLIDIPLSNQLYLQPGAFYNWNNIKFSNEIDYTLYGLGTLLYTQRYKVHYMQIPLSVVYKSGYENMGRFFCGAGPYIGFHLGGNQRSRYPIIDSSGSEFSHFFKNEDSEIEIGNSGNTNHQFRQLDYGIHSMMGYESNVNIYFKGTFSYGFANIAPEGSGITFRRNWSIGFSIGVLLGKDDW